MQRHGIIVCLLHVLLRSGMCDFEPKEKACDAPEPGLAHALLQVKGDLSTHAISIEEGKPSQVSALFRREFEGGAIYTGVGQMAALDDKGFFSVAATCCKLEMMVFIRRTLASMAHEVCVEAGLAALVPQFTCDTATESPSNKSFSILKETLYRSAPPEKCAAVAPTGTCFSSGSRMPIEPGHDDMLEECKKRGKYDFNGMQYAKHCRDASGNMPPALAKEILPEELYLLGLSTFGGEAHLNEIVLEANHMKVKYAGEELELRIRKGDDALLRYGMPGEDGRDYGLPVVGREKASLLQGSSGVMNMIDVGGNYGVVSIAMFKALEGKIRTVAVEAMPSTYFFLRWNMWINGVPHLEAKDVHSPNALGVAAINAGVTGNDQVIVSMCSSPENSMNSAKNTGGCPPKDTVTVPGVSVDTLMKLFGKETISLLKLDCEGCEQQAAPELVKYTSRVRRVVGELHAPSENVIDSVCKFNAERYFTKICKVKKSGIVVWEAISLSCGDAKRAVCNW